ncbi:MAG: hypothetical protein Q7R66_01020 [Undibacterium sp.]|uniref:hypothetical protein n=1 Tax=Undibacterium sp. TaxID=1914977 RepID=UPI00271B00AB|nr:hypothetical protein [Undibacterium sp.]MDO8650759.1 hypothetical protein [Undibacterium sp.]
MPKKLGLAKFKRETRFRQSKVNQFKNYMPSLRQQVLECSLRGLPNTSVLEEHVDHIVLGDNGGFAGRDNNY